MITMGAEYGNTTGDLLRSLKARAGSGSLTGEGD